MHEESENLYAAVRFYDDETKKIEIVSVASIKDFICNDNYPNPFYVKRFSEALNEEIYEPAQILAVSDNKEELSHNKKRYIFHKLRYSDAVEFLQKEAVEKRDDHSDVLDKPSDKTNEWKTSLKLKDRSDNDLIIQKKLDALNSVALTFESSKSVSKFVTKDPEKETSNFEIHIDEKNELLNKLDICYTKIKTLEAENEKLQNVVKETEQEIKQKNVELHELKGKIKYMEMCNNKHSPTCTSLKSLRESATRRELFPQSKKRLASPMTPLVSPILSSRRHSILRKKYNESVDDEDCRLTEPPAENIPEEFNDVAVLNESQSSDKRKKTEKSKKDKKLNKENGERSKKDIYDSDEYNKSANRIENFTAWTDDSKDGMKIKMMHLRYGVSIPYNAWKEAREQKTASLFVRKISKSIWGCHALMNRAVEVQKINKERLVHRSPRKPLTPKKKAVLEKCYIHYLKLHNQMPKNISCEKEKVLSKKWRRYLSVYINYLITTELEKLKAEEEDSTSNSSS